MDLVFRHILESANRNRENIALICNNKKVSYGDLISRSNAFSEMFILEGLQKGDRVLVLLNDSIDLIITSYAVMNAGGIAIPLPESTSHHEIRRAVKNGKPSIIVTSRDDLARHPFLRDTVNCQFFFIDETRIRIFHNDIIARAQQHCGTNTETISQFMGLHENDCAVMIFHTKHPISLTQKNIVQLASNNYKPTINGSNICKLATVHFSEPFGMISITRSLISGETIVIQNKNLKPVNFIQTILKYNCNAITAHSKIFCDLFDSTSALLKQHGKKILLIEMEGSKILLSDKRKMLTFFPQAKIFIYFNPAEGFQGTVLELREERKKLCSVGRSLPDVEISIRDENFHALKKGEIGQIAIRTMHNLQKDFSEDWYRTEEIGYLDDDGYLFIVEQKDDIITVGNLKFAPSEVEEKIHGIFPDYETCVVGIPDPAGILGEIPVLCYIAQDGRTITPSELFKTLVNKIDKNKIPKIVYRMRSFPKMEHKILRSELRKKILDDFTHPVTELLK